MNYNEVLDTLKEEMEILVEEEKKSGAPLKNGREPSCETKGQPCTGGEPACDAEEKKPAVKAAEMPEVAAMVSAILLLSLQDQFLLQFLHSRKRMEAKI